MKQKVGKTGLTQKEAIFQIISGVLGARLAPGANVESLIAHKTAGDLKPRWHSPELDKMIALVSEGLLDGTVPSKYNSASDRGKVREYANRITHYWIRHDRRLNGGQSGTRASKKKQRETGLQARLKFDPQLKALHELFEKCPYQTDRLEIETFIMGRTFAILLETFEVDREEIPQSLRARLKLDEVKEKSPTKKSA